MKVSDPTNKPNKARLIDNMVTISRLTICAIIAQETIIVAGELAPVTCLGNLPEELGGNLVRELLLCCEQGPV